MILSEFSARPPRRPYYAQTGRPSPISKIMKIFNIPFPQSQILYRPSAPPPSRQPPAEPLLTLRTVPGVPFSAPPVPNPPPNRARCPIFRPTCPRTPAEPCPVSHSQHHLSRKPLPTVPGVPFSAPPVPNPPPNRARCPTFGTIGAVWRGKEKKRNGREERRLMKRRKLRTEYPERSTAEGGTIP